MVEFRPFRSEAEASLRIDSEPGFLNQCEYSFSKGSEFFA